MEIPPRGVVREHEFEEQLSNPIPFAPDADEFVAAAETALSLHPVPGIPASVDRSIWILPITIEQLTNSDVDGTAAWIAPARKKHPFPAGFQPQLTILGYAFHPGTAKAPVIAAGARSLSIGDADLPAELTPTVSYKAPSTLLITAPIPIPDKLPLHQSRDRMDHRQLRRSHHQEIDLHLCDHAAEDRHRRVLFPEPDLQRLRRAGRRCAVGRSAGSARASAFC